MKRIWCFTLLLFFSFFGTANASILFSDQIINGEYSFDNNLREMVMDFNTIYQPYDSETGVYYPNGQKGAGTIITWQLTLDFSSWVAPGGELPGEWEESWANGFRLGLFDNFSYVQTGQNSLGENTGAYFGTIVEAQQGLDLAPEGPWYIFGNLTRTWTSNDPGYYISGGTIDGTVTNVPVPEPATMLLLGSGLIGLAAAGRRKFFKK